MKSKRVREFIKRYTQNINKNKNNFGSGKDNYTEAEWNAMSLAEKARILGVSAGNQESQQLPGGEVKSIPGSDAVEFAGATHNQGGIMLDSQTEVEDGETMDKVNMARGGGKRDYFFSSYLKEGGVPFSARHKQLLSMGAPQSAIDELARLQESKAGRTTSSIAKTGGVYETGGELTASMKETMEKHRESTIRSQMKEQNWTRKQAEDWYNETFNVDNKNQTTISPDTRVEEGEIVRSTPLVTSQTSWEKYIHPPKNMEEADSRIKNLENWLSEMQSWGRTSTYDPDSKEQKYNSEQIKLVTEELNKQKTHKTKIKKTSNQNENIKGETIEEENVNKNTNKYKPINYFSNDEEGNAFRKWINENYPEYADEIDLDEEGDYNNAYIERAYKEHGDEYNTSLKELSTSYDSENPIKGMYVDEEGNIYERGTTGKWRVRYNKATAEGIPEFGEMQYDYEDDWTDIESEDDINLSVLKKYEGEVPKVTEKKKEIIDDGTGDEELPKKGFWDQTKAAQLAQLIPAYAAFKETPDYMETQQVQQNWSPVIPERIAKTHLDRVDLNADRARNAADYRGMNKFIEESGLGPAAMANRMAAYSRKQQGDNQITAKEAQINTTIANQEASMNQQSAAANAKAALDASMFNARSSQTIEQFNATQRAYTDEFNRGADAATKDRRLMALQSAMTSLAGMNRDRLMYNAQDRLSMAIGGRTTGIMNREQLARDIKKAYPDLDPASEEFQTKLENIYLKQIKNKDNGQQV